MDEKDPTVRNVVLSRQQIVVLSPANIAIQEFRYNHLPVLDGAIDIVHGEPLEIIVDQHPAALSFTGAATGAAILLARGERITLEGGEQKSIEIKR